MTFAPSAVGDDFDDQNGEIIFISSSPPTQCFSLNIINDPFFESDESFTIRLQQAGQPDQFVTVTIISDDSLSTTIAVEDSAYSVNEEDGSLNVCVVVSGDELLTPATITVITNDITADGTYCMGFV